MNSDQFLTHWEGRPLRDLDRDEVVEALQTVYKWYKETQADKIKVASNRGLSEYFVL
jgi:hypothetical protein